VLAQAIADEEPVVRGAAAWAFGRWHAAGVAADRPREALAARLTVEPDDTVRREIAAALG
jgi:HEAT repeat protein